MELAALVKNFEGDWVTTLRTDGRCAWLVRDIGRALRYEDDGNGLVDRVARDFRKALVRGYDFDLIALPETGGLGVGGPRWVLRSPGLRFVCMQTPGDRAMRLASFLIDEVAPQLSRVARPSPALAVRKHALAVYDRATRSDLLRDAIAARVARGDDPEVAFATALTEVAEISTGLTTRFAS